MAAKLRAALDKGDLAELQPDVIGYNDARMLLMVAGTWAVCGNAAA